MNYKLSYDIHSINRIHNNLTGKGKIMRLAILFITIFIISSCQSFSSNDPDSLMFDIPAGSTLTLNKNLTIGDRYTHAVIQDGKEIPHDEIQDYAINCRLDFKDFGPRSIEPEVFKITRTEDGQNWISQPSILRFYTEIYLTSDKSTDVIKMVCQEYGDPSDRNFTVKEMATALGDYFSFSFNKSN
jgi:hypothetical protein